MEEGKYFSPPATDTKTLDVWSLIIPFTVMKTEYHYFTGDLPCKSSRVNKYIIILYDYDGNMILSKEIKNKQVGTIIDPQKYIHNILK